MIRGLTPQHQGEVNETDNLQVGPEIKFVFSLRVVIGRREYERDNQIVI